MPRPLIAVAVTLVVAAAAVGGVLLDRRDGVDARTADLVAAEEARTVEDAAAVTATAQDVVDVLSPMAESLAGPSPAAADVATWTADVAALQDRLAAEPGGSTAANAARSALRSTVALTGSSLEAHALAADAPEDALAVRLGAHAADLGDQALRSWVTAATLVDVANVDAGLGHVHLTLAPGVGVDH
ncbi:hypothetical protein [Aquipuribacter sp. SD81]|uniref:hypothetical protein n=1 Tax=Aquipuribacter sp. SD81 TaxID=3127703 RepID=UPI00301B56CF